MVGNNDIVIQLKGMANLMNAEELFHVYGNSC
jgi:hypothetical protein